MKQKTQSKSLQITTGMCAKCSYVSSIPNQFLVYVQMHLMLICAFSKPTSCLCTNASVVNLCLLYIVYCYKSKPKTSSLLLTVIEKSKSRVDDANTSLLYT